VIASACHVGGMPLPALQTCEVKVGSVWCAMGLDDAASQHALAL
jgi:hypothetical protein